jgi:hypothetical protein
MKNVFYFILGICLVVLTSAATASLTIIEPARPKSVIVFSSYSEEYIGSKIRDNNNLGYIVKSCSANSNGGKWLVVMEKY